MIRIMEEKEPARSGQAASISDLTAILSRAEISENGYCIAITDMQELRTLCDQLAKRFCK